MLHFHEKHNSVAVIRGRKSMRFDKLLKEIDRVAASLEAMGVKKGDNVMLALPNILQCVVLVYAISRIGAVASMIHPLWSTDEFDGAVKKLRPKIVFLSDVNLKKFKGSCHGAKVVMCPYLFYGFVGLKRGKGFTPFTGDGEEAMFYLQSGGTAGSPKTIVLSSRAVNAMVNNLISTLGDRFDEKNRMLTVMPMFHGFGLCIGVHASLCLNMTSVLMARFDAKKVAKEISKRRITNILAVPRMISKLLALDSFYGDKISSIEEVYVGGDSVSDALVHEFENRIASSGGKAKILPGYGLTETVTVCALTRDKFTEGSIGQMLEGMKAKVIDDDGNVLGVGERGELVIAGEQLMSGYFGDEQATKDVMLDMDGEQWVKTGDLVSMDEDGRIFFLGRKKRLIKISGMNVFPSDIESKAQELDFVHECVAVEFHIDGKPFIRLLVEGDLTEAQKDEIIEYIKRHLSHWNTPREVVAVPAFPRTQIGKVDVKKLLETYGGDQQK